MNNYKFIVYPGNNSFVIRDALLKRGNWKEVQHDDPNINLAEIDFIWSPNNFTTKEYEKLLESQKKNPDHKLLINHFENNTSLTTKSEMIKALNNHYKKNVEAMRGGYNAFHSIPASYVLVVGVNTVDLRDFQIKFNEINKSNFKRCSLPEKHCSQNVWILKPENQSQGKGIELFQSLKSILSFLHYKPAFSKWVIQKYIERPLLYNGRKFDLRVWVLFTNKGELFVYKNGYLRTSSSKYSMQTFNDAIHLTNWSLQKGMQNYEKHELGNRLPLKEGLHQYNVDYEKHIYPRMKDLIIDLVKSCEGEMFSSKKLKNCFELYGFDFIIDEDLRCWLIEANRNPGFGLPTEKAKQLIDDMVDEMLRITVDNYFTPKAALEPRQSVFDLIYTMRLSPFNKFQPKNDRRSFNMNVYPIQQLEPKSLNGERRFQVYYPQTEQQIQNMIEKQRKQDIDTATPNQGKLIRNMTCTSDQFKMKDNENIENKIETNHDNINQNEENVLSKQMFNSTDTFSNIPRYIKSRGKSFNRREYANINAFLKTSESIKQIPLDFENEFTNFSSTPISQSQPQLQQRVSSIILTSTGVSESQLTLPIRKESVKEQEDQEFEDTYKNATQNTFQKVIQEPLNQITNKRIFNSEKTSFHQVGQAIRNQSPHNNFSKTQNARFSQSPEKRQFINRSYNRSLMKIQQQKDQLSNQAQDNSQGQENQVKSLRQSRLSQNLRYKLGSPVLQPQLFTIEYTSPKSNNNNNSSKKFNQEQKDIYIPFSIPKENNYFSKLYSTQSRFSQNIRLSQ